MRLETKLSLGVASVLLLGLLALSLTRLRQEEVAINLRTGAMRLDRYFLGFQHAREDIDSGLEWVAEIAPPGEDRWVPMLIRDHGALLRGSSHGRRIGQVYADALTMAKVLHADQSALRAAVQTIVDADFDAIWPLRQSLRAAYDRKRSAGPPARPARPAGEASAPPFPAPSPSPPSSPP